MLKRPEPNEYDPYFSKYINLVPDGNILEFLEQQRNRLNIFFGNLSEEQDELHHVPGKWNFKELFGHINDSERVMSYWMLSVARGDSTKLLGYDQDIYVDNGCFGEHTITELLVDFEAVRQATRTLLTTIREKDWLREGHVVNKAVTARSLLYVMVGHTEHHLSLIQQHPSNFNITSL
ncbi:DinB family protein [Brevibacillus ginsengisoli]|uniref:DinB family protein n=1 Tax=Brevibacillus ginsengisoli TaxID=363854 RepID=UPI003CE6A100